MTRKTILITGCSSGIGHAAAHGLGARGWRVFATCRQQKDVDRLRLEGLECLRLDYADHDSMTAAVGEIFNRTGGRLDALFNNGAFGLPGAVEDLPTDGLRAIFEVYLFGWHELVLLVIQMVRAQGAVRIVQCSSVLGLVPMKWRGAYVATKYALEGLTDVLRLEMADTGIRVILIEPGPVTSRIRVNSIPHFERWIDWRASPRAAQYEASLLKRLYEDRGRDPFELPPEAVVQKLLRALESPNPRPRYYVTTATHIMSALRRLLPTRALDAIIQRG
ncbi:SDR family NAD(P)-dependent oxidoreductase [Tropicimonas sp.]|uniref:SDR family NAD(P)-dependent oxidoreductase n=1 Tax=Tropicimonas sp. TaxID=2067044 RepID=UPI003A8C2206